ncbi:MAG: hypothetical protein K6B14_05455 [Lachnospiraceae bacterium]|nr:hypothetical protein [Lachnospiraceae bacterium]
MKTVGFSANFTNTVNHLYNSPSESGSSARSSFISRKTKAVQKQADERNKLLRDLDKKSSAVSVHSYDNAGLSAEELHKRQINAKRQQNTFKATAIDKSEGFLKLSQAKSTTEDKKIKKHLEYSYRDISSMIRQAKTSSTAGQAAIKAKRQVLSLRRKMANASDTDEKAEIYAALNHAKSMERTAKKKKRHLETEEMIESAIKQDEKPEKAPSSDGATTTDLVSQAENVVDEAYEQVDEMELSALQDAYNEFFKDTPEMEEFSLEEISLEDLSSQMMEDFDEAYEMLDQVMENLGMLEAVDPHMDEESLKELRTRHRSSEEKDMTKADMEYLKAIFEKYQQDMEKAKAGAAVGMTASSPALSGITYTPGAPAAEVSGLPTVDVAI